MNELRDIIEAQRSLQARYGHDFTTMDREARIVFIRTMVLAAHAELTEVLDEVPGWKPWTQTDAEMDVRLFRKELIDVLHFIINLFLVTASDVTSDELAGMIAHIYLDKNAQNRKRQDDGYDGKSGKCPSCNRAVDDIIVEEVRLDKNTVGFCVCGYHLYEMPNIQADLTS